METGQTTDTGKSFKNYFQIILTHRRFPFVVAVLAILLTLPSLKAGWLVDDYHHKLLMSGSESIVQLLDCPLDMFNFLDGDPQHTAKLIDYGLLPWWTYEQIKGGFWRPLASLTHWLDYMLWPDIPLIMHAHSIVLYGVLAMVVACLYRRFATIGWIAGLAAILYAIEDAHGTPVGWLSNRNAVLATLFGVLALIVHDRWRRNGWRLGIALGPLLLAVSLLSAEAGIATCAYLAAYALFIDRARFVRRFTALIPCVAVVFIWRYLWTYLGYGITNLGGYVDPLGEPLRFISWVIDRGPFLLQGQLAMPPADICIVLSSQTWNMLWRGACVFLVLLALVFFPLLKQNRTARFWAVGMLLSVLPICATFPSDRLLLFVGIGAMGLIAEFVAFVFTKIQWRWKLLLWRIPAMLLAVLFIFIHLIIAPLALSFRAAYPMGPKEFIDSLQNTMSFDRSIENQDLVVVNPPSAFVALTCLPAWESNGQPLPRHLRILASSQFRPVEIHRINDKTIKVRPRDGYLVLVFDKLFRNKQHSLSVGDKVELTGMTVEITELTSDGRPAEAEFTFTVGLEDPSLHWLQYKDGRFVSFSPPAIGRSVKLPGFNPFRN